jgi:D-alanyl-D-alanine carboxypeptidase
MLKEQVERILNKTVKKTKTLQFAMSLPAQGINYSYSSTIPNQRFHCASVGKLMTATLILMAIEQGKLKINTRIKSILEPGVLDRLFVFEGTDFQEEITVKHLLGHMSGINDYFESKTLDGSIFTDEVIKNPATFWKPSDLLDYTRNRQKAVARPGEEFFYSDTGYILLGLIVKEVFGMPFNQALDTFIFKPSRMDETYLCFYSDGFDQKALAPLYINGVDVHLFNSLSCDFSGGGLSTTANDLLKFLDHLQNQGFIGQQSLDQMASFDHRYRQGLYYGYGMMQVRFEEFFFLLKNLPRLQGHIGVTGVHAWYDPATKGTFVLNMGNTKDVVLSFKLLIKIIQLIQRDLEIKKMESN